MLFLLKGKSKALTWITNHIAAWSRSVYHRVSYAWKVMIMLHRQGSKGDHDFTFLGKTPALLRNSPTDLIDATEEAF
jgi:hypothetical protein